MGDSETSPLLFVVTQTARVADGGVTSLSEILCRVRRFRPMVLTNCASPRVDFWRERGIPVEIVGFDAGPAASRATKLAALARANLRVARILRDRRVRLVHCNDVLAFFAAAPAARLRGARLVVNVRNVKEPPERYGLRWRVMSRTADQLVVLSKDMASRLESRLGARGTITPIYSIVDTRAMRPASPEERDSLRQALGIPQDAFLVVCVGTVDPRKGQHELIERAGAGLASIPRCVVAFVGDFDAIPGSYADACREAVRRLGVPPLFRFEGPTGRVADWYRAADVTLVASRREGLARCMIESLACGTPVVSFDVASAREVLEDNGGGRVVPQGDYDGLVAALRELAATPELRRELGARGRDTALRLFEPDGAVAAYEALYASLASVGSAWARAASANPNRIQR